MKKLFMSIVVSVFLLSIHIGVFASEVQLEIKNKDVITDFSELFKDIRIKKVWGEGRNRNYRIYNSFESKGEKLFTMSFVPERLEIVYIRFYPSIKLRLGWGRKDVFVDGEKIEITWNVYYTKQYGTTNNESEKFFKDLKDIAENIRYGKTMTITVDSLVSGNSMFYYKELKEKNISEDEKYLELRDYSLYFKNK